MNVAAMTRAFWKVTRFARAARFWWVLVLAFAALLAQCFGAARAANCGYPSTTEAENAASAVIIFTNAETAAQACNSTANLAAGGQGGGWHDRWTRESCTVVLEENKVKIQWRHLGVWNGCSNNYSGAEAEKDAASLRWQFTNVCPAGEVWNPVTQTCEGEQTCDVNGPPLAGGWVKSPDDQAIFTCSGGCEYADNNSSSLCSRIDGQYYCSVDGWTRTGFTCTPGDNDGAVPPSDSDGDGASDENDQAPNNPGDTGGNDPHDGDSGEDDSGTCGGEGQPACDGTNGGSGQGNTSGGGGNCGSPPHSSGDAILAQIAYQTWATRCAVEGQGNGGSGGGDGDAISIEDGGTIEDMETPWVDGEGIEPSEWDSGLGGGSCPAPLSETITIAGHSATVEFSFDPLCQFATLMQAIVITMSLLLSAYIIAGVRV